MWLNIQNVDVFLLANGVITWWDFSSHCMMSRWLTWSTHVRLACYITHRALRIWIYFYCISCRSRFVESTACTLLRNFINAPIKMLKYEKIKNTWPARMDENVRDIHISAYSTVIMVFHRKFSTMQHKHLCLCVWPLFGRYIQHWLYIDGQRKASIDPKSFDWIRWARRATCRCFVIQALLA